MTVTPLAPSLGGRRTNYDHGIRVTTRREETDREKEAFFFTRGRKEDGVHRHDGGKADIHPLVTEDRLRGLMQWCKDADGARRCFATGPMLPNVCIMDRVQGLSSWT